MSDYNRFFETEHVSDLPHDYDPSLNGISGWMVVVVIGRILTALLGAYNSLMALDAMATYNVTDPVMQLMLIFDLLITVGLSIVILVFIFKRNILFRTLFIIQFALLILETIILGSHLYATYGYSLELSSYASLAGGIIWVIYLFVSKRVKNTFIYNKLYAAPFSSTAQ